MSQEDEIERLAMEELLAEAKRGAERAKDLGVSGWVKPVVPPTNKRFLRNTLASTLRNPLRGTKHRIHSSASESSSDSDYEDRRRRRKRTYSNHRRSPVPDNTYYTFPKQDTPKEPKVQDGAENKPEENKNLVYVEGVWKEKHKKSHKHKKKKHKHKHKSEKDKEKSERTDDKNVDDKLDNSQGKGSDVKATSGSQDNGSGPTGEHEKQSALAQDGPAALKRKTLANKPKTQTILTLPNTTLSGSDTEKEVEKSSSKKLKKHKSKHKKHKHKKSKTK